jgi:hypothetical protein
LVKGPDSCVRTVPGCNATQSAAGLRRFNSMAAVRTNWFSAAWEAR